MTFSTFRKESFLSIVLFIFVLFVSFYIASAQSEGTSVLVSRWSGDEVSGGTALDTNDGNDGTISGAVTVGPGKSGNAFKFDGTSGSITMGNPASLNFGTGPFSLEAWFMWDGGGSSVNNIIRKSNYGPGPGSGYWLRIGRDSKVLEFSIGATTGPEGQTLLTAPISPGVWHHVVATRNSSDTVKLYVDGQSTGTFVREASAAESTSGSPFALGSWADQRSEFFSGEIEEVLVYSEALDSSEVARAYLRFQITFPIPELGNCRNKGQCATYCESDDTDVIRDCIDFAKKYKLLSDEEIEEIEKELALDLSKGPGGCTDEASCRTYCEDVDNIEECLAYVEEFDLATPDELQEMRQMAAAKDAGVPFPGNCETRQSCLRYCEAPSHAVECVAFAEAAGFISGDEAAQARKFAPLIARGETPGQCTTKDECEAYCEQGAHIDECLDFAIKHELFPPDEIEIMKKIQPFVKAGTMPGGCKSKTECEAYCTDGEHFEECLEIGLAIGVINPDEVEMMRKSGGKGPGNCRSREACDAYCSDPNNQKECMDFAVRIGLMTPEEAEQAQSAGDMSQCFEEADEKITACFVTNLGADMFEQMKAGKMPHDTAILEKMRKAKACMKQYSDQATDILEDFLKAMPVANACIAGELGPDFVERLRKMTVPCSQMKGITGTMEACFQKGMSALFEPCAAKDCGEIQSCMMDVSKSFMGITGQVEGGDHPEFQEQKFPPVLQEKLNSCGIDANFDPNICVSEPTCKEFFSCLNPSGSQTDEKSSEEPSGDMPPELQARMDSCKGELVEIMKEEIQAKIDACLVLSCPEFQACMQSLQQSGGEQQEQQEQTPDPAIQAKFESCFSGDVGGGPPPGDNGPPSGMPPSGGGDQSQIPEGYSSWQEFCMAQPGDSRCSSSMPQVDCSLFAPVPSCSYITDPEGYKYCKQCYPDK